MIPMGSLSKESRCLRHPYFTFKDQLCRFRIMRSADDPELGAAQKIIPPLLRSLVFFIFKPFQVNLILKGIIRFAADPRWGRYQKNPDVFDICISHLKTNSNEFDCPLNAKSHFRGILLQRGRDSNPRGLAPNTLSRRAP